MPLAQSRDFLRLHVTAGSQGRSLTKKGFMSSRSACSQQSRRAFRHAGESMNHTARNEDIIASLCEQPLCTTQNLKLALDDKKRFITAIMPMWRGPSPSGTASMVGRVGSSSL